MFYIYVACFNPPAPGEEQNPNHGTPWVTMAEAQALSPDYVNTNIISNADFNEVFPGRTADGVRAPDAAPEDPPPPPPPPPPPVVQWLVYVAAIKCVTMAEAQALAPGFGAVSTIIISDAAFSEMFPARTDGTRAPDGTPP
jgi:hypothetical protein